jgi:UDP-N-acetylglucosamine 2-epimerase (non-hydrolysing)
LPTVIVCVVGARPNFVKAKPVVDALDRREETVLVHTGQHFDAAMSDEIFGQLGLRRPDVELGIKPAPRARQCGEIMLAIDELLEARPPRLVVVFGDVTSTVAAAMAAAQRDVPVAHVEAGLRSRDWTMPEELNRVVTDRVSRHLLCPSSDAVENLAAEQIVDGVHLVGNVMVDSLLRNIDAARARAVHERWSLAPGGYVLVTLHRPDNVDDPEQLARLVAALGEVGRDVPVLFPVHPRTARVLPESLPPGVIVTAPLGYLDFLGLQAAAAAVITDSGGVQEETTVLGVPCITVRDNTERPITISEGTNRLIGRDAAGLVAATRDVLADPPSPRCPALWDGAAGERIAAVLTK